MTGLDSTDGDARPGPDRDGLTLSGMRRVIASCDRFEEAWRGGGSPRAEEFLGDAAGLERATLLRKLIAREVGVRRDRGESPREGEFLKRFPDDVSAVLSVLGGGVAAAPAAPPGATAQAPEPEPTVSPVLPPRGQSDTDPGDGPAVGDRPPTASEPTASRTVELHEEQTDNHPVGPPIPMPERIGRYQVRRLLGEGGFGRVYHAWDAELGRNVAVKVPRAGSFVTRRHAEAFVREARLAAGLKHPSIVTVHDTGHDDDGMLFVVLEYVEGQSLSDLLRSETVSHRRLAELMAQVAEALHYAHSRGLVHRDLKPANLLVDTAGRPHVTDFGLAVHEEGVRSLGRQIAGTLHYMAPEQVRGESHRLDGRTDLWGLGVVLYQMLTGRLPFAGRERSQVFDEIVHREPAPPCEVDPDLPHELSRICMKCLSKRMSDRYPTALELSADLWYWIEMSGKAAGPADDPARPARGARPSPPTETDSTAWRPRVRVVPKGLRSFDASDEAFFVALLPGPYDRDGLPESLRFWKTRVESTDHDEAFPVGLLYGPSGSGKSSLIKAGLIPRLAPHVRPIYLEATPDGTEAGLLRGLRRACLALPRGLAPAEALRAVRETPALRRGKKLLIVVDQFEQWLHARRPGRGDGLVEALRQCDGVSVQCLVVTRDDFGTATMRFMNALEVPVVEGKNYALVDRFDAGHARAVLEMFGRALGRLPEESALAPDQERFLDRAVADMAEDGKVSPVRLSLFAEMFRGTPWEPAMLRRVGGAEGIGIAYLEEALGSAAANPRHKPHQEAARAVLRSLLPSPGVNIKGHMRPYAELLAASPYADRPDAFNDLISVLDGELRLISPCDPGKGGPDSSQLTDAPAVAVPGSPVPLADRSYQLTHDYLVRSLRKWLTRTQAETAGGRARLLLENRAAVWDGRPDPRYLPSLPEWAWIRLLVRPTTWTPAQARMMGSAGRRYLLRLAAAGVLVGAVVVAGLRVDAGLERERRARRSESLVATLWLSRIESAEAVIDAMEPYRPLWRDRVAGVAREPDNTAGDRTRALLALARSESWPVPPLVERLLRADPPEHRAIGDALDRWQGQASARLWDEVARPKLPGPRFLRAAAALARFDPDDPRWDRMAEPLVRWLVVEPSGFVADWVDTLAPVFDRLVVPLEGVASNPKRPASERLSAAAALARFAGNDSPALIVDLAKEESDPDGFRLVISRLSSEGEGALEALRDELGLPVPSAPDEHERLARRQANAAIALICLGHAGPAWPLLGASADPSVRTCMIHRMLAFGVAAADLFDRLRVEPDPAARQAILLALGEPSAEAGARGREDETVAELERLYREDDDASVHSAAEWLLRRLVKPDRLARILDDLKGSTHAGWSVNGQRQTMVHVRDTGTFRMGTPAGSPASLRDRNEVEHPRRVKRPFAVSAHEVTVAQFLQYDPAAPYDKEVCFDRDGPMTKVTWYEALRYCRWLSEQESVNPAEMCYPPLKEIGEGVALGADLLDRAGYRLPTEAEWEYAVRAGTETPWFFGEDPAFLKRYAWYLDNSDLRVWPGGLLKPNPRGLFDVYGNALEWCQDRTADYPLDPDADVPESPEPGTGPASRVQRGGYYRALARDTRSARRYESWPEKRLSYHGLRVVRTLKD